MLGLAGVDFDENKSQITHGETVRETAVMVSFNAEVTPSRLVDSRRIILMDSV